MPIGIPRDSIFPATIQSAGDLEAARREVREKAVLRLQFSDEIYREFRSETTDKPAVASIYDSTVVFGRPIRTTAFSR